MDPCSYLTNPDEILNVDDDVWETSLKHDPRAGITAEQIAQGRVTEIKRLSEECNVFVPRPQSEVPPHLKNISSRWEIQSCCSVCREFRRGEPRTDLFAVASSSITPRLTGKIGGVTFTFDITSAPVMEPCVVDPPQEWLEHLIKHGGDPRVCWALIKGLQEKRTAPQG